MPRYAAVDIGSNSVRMEAAEVNEGGPSRILASERQVTRLGASVFRGGRISQESMDMICGVLGGMAAQYKRLDVMGVRAVATARTPITSRRLYCAAMPPSTPQIMFIASWLMRPPRKT